MKRLLLIISILALVLLPIGCDVQDMIKNAIENAIEKALDGIRGDYTIEVTVPMGLNFTGKYYVVEAEYHPDEYVVYTSTSHNVSGNTTINYKADGATTVGAMFQKQSDTYENLEVKVYRGTVLVDSANTTAPWGAVIVLGVKAG